MAFLFFNGKKQEVLYNIPNLDYMLNANEGGYVFAHYQTPIVSKVNIPSRHVNVPNDGWFHLSPGVIVDAGGIGISGNGPHPIDPLRELAGKLLTSVALLSLSSNMEESVQLQAKSLIGFHLDSIKQSIMPREIK